MSIIHCANTEVGFDTEMVVIEESTESDYEGMVKLACLVFLATVSFGVKKVFEKKVDH